LTCTHDGAGAGGAGAGGGGDDGAYGGSDDRRVRRGPRGASSSPQGMLGKGNTLLNAVGKWLTSTMVIDVRDRRLADDDDSAGGGDDGAGGGDDDGLGAGAGAAGGDDDGGGAGAGAAGAAGGDDDGMLAPPIPPWCRVRMRTFTIKYACLRKIVLLKSYAGEKCTRVMSEIVCIYTGMPPRAFFLLLPCLTKEPQQLLPIPRMQQEMTMVFIYPLFIVWHKFCIPKLIHLILARLCLLPFCSVASADKFAFHMC
jgi:hypothetical protein